MSDKPRRAWFQIHLSTAIVMMFVAGGLMWANFRMRSLRDDSIYLLGGDESDHSRYYVRGWPVVFLHTKVPTRSEGMFIGAPKTYDGEWIVDGLIFDPLFAVFVTISVGLVSEFFIRRREARAP